MTTTKVRLERKATMLREQIEDMNRNNDGSLGWVDDLRELIVELDEVEAQIVANEISEGGNR